MNTICLHIDRNSQAKCARRSCSSWHVGRRSAAGVLASTKESRLMLKIAGKCRLQNEPTKSAFPARQCGIRFSQYKKDARTNPNPPRRAGQKGKHGCRFLCALRVSAVNAFAFRRFRHCLSQKGLLKERVEPQACSTSALATWTPALPFRRSFSAMPETLLQFWVQLLPMRADLRWGLVRAVFAVP